MFCKKAQVSHCYKLEIMIKYVIYKTILVYNALMVYSIPRVLCINVCNDQHRKLETDWSTLQGHHLERYVHK